MRIGVCPDCGKTVRDKPIFGTLHMCLSEDERRTKLEHEAREAHVRLSMAQQNLQALAYANPYLAPYGQQMSVNRARRRVPWPRAQWVRC